MDFLKKAWAFMDGNKTKAGAVLVVVGKFLAYIGKPEFGEPIEQVGNVIAGVGLAHAGVKAVS